MLINISQKYLNHIFIAGSVSGLQLATNDMWCDNRTKMMRAWELLSPKIVTKLERTSGADSTGRGCGWRDPGPVSQVSAEIITCLLFLLFSAPLLALRSEIRVLKMQTNRDGACCDGWWTSAPGYYPSPQTSGVLLAHLTLTGIILCKYSTDNMIQWLVTGTS